MTPEQQKEELSRAWLCAVAASCGYALASWSQDQECIDVTLNAPGVEQLVLRKCAYYAVARRLDPIAGAAESKVVQVPFNQPFTPAALRAMMERVSREEPL